MIDGCGEQMRALYQSDISIASNHFVIVEKLRQFLAA